MPRLRLSASSAGTGFTGVSKAQRVTTGSIGGAGSAAVTITWTTAFSNANYTVSAAVVQADATVTTLRVHHVESVTATAVVVRIVNDDTLNAKTGTLHVMATQD